MQPQKKKKRTDLKLFGPETECGPNQFQQKIIKHAVIQREERAEVFPKRDTA